MLGGVKLCGTDGHYSGVPEKKISGLQCRGVLYGRGGI